MRSDYPVGLAGAGWSERRKIHIRWVIKLDESVMLLSRGRLWRVNPRSASGMKQGHGVIRGVNRQEVEKTCRRNVSGEVNPG
jgi:hypothetical protein